MKLLVAGGGSGGHVFPALAVAREWKRRGEGREVVIAGTERGIETRLVPAAGLPLELLRVRGLKGIRGLRFLRNLAQLPLGLRDSFSILGRHRFDAALGVGGYVSGPMMLAAICKGVPSVLFEPNVQPGFTNGVLGRLARRVAVAHEETLARWGSKSMLTGCPVRAEFFQAAPREHLRPLSVLITGGSQGSRAINRAVSEAIALLAPRKNEFTIVHQTGEREFAAIQETYRKLDFPAEILPFLDDMPARFAASDLIICRAGAITVAEICAAGRAAIFVPFGAATDSHQLRNARAMESAGAGRVLTEAELSGGSLSQAILEYADHPERLEEIERRARAQGQPRATEAIVDLIEEVARP